MANGNGAAPTKQGKRLVAGSYDQQVMQSLGDGRMIDRQFILRHIGEFNPEYVPLHRLRQMRKDSMIKLGLHFILALLARAEYDFKCEDPRVAAGMKEMYDAVHVPWLRTACNMHSFGYQGTVRQYKLGSIDGTYENKQGNLQKIWTSDSVQPVVLGVPIPLPPDDTRVHMTDGRYNGIDTPLVKAAEGTDQPSIPKEFTLWFTNEFEEEFRNYYGTPRILPAYKPWWSYWFTWHHRDRHAEMDADPALQVWYPIGSIPDPEDTTWQAENRPQKRISNKTMAQQIGDDLRNGATIVWPSDVYTDEQGRMTPTPLWRADFLKGGENLTAFNTLLDSLKMDKLLGVLVPPEMAQQQTGGPSSRATLEGYSEIFTESLELTAKYYDTLLNSYQLNDIAKANWGEGCPPVRKVTTGFQSDDLELATDLIKLAFTTDPNALPINFEELVKRAGLPTYTKAEQDKREQEAADQQSQAQEQQAQQGQIGPLPGEGLPGAAQPPNQPPAGAASPTQLAASQDAGRTESKPYEREHIYLSTTIPTQAPGWARREAKRRDRNVNAIAERLAEVVEQRYQDAFSLAADALSGNVPDEDATIELGVADRVKQLIDAVVRVFKGGLGAYDQPLAGELAGMYHVAGAAELSRLGLSAESWDVGRDDIQEWARTNAGRLIKTMDETVVEQHIRPWLSQVLSQAGYGDTPTGIPVDTMELAAQLTDKFANYPRWMAERVVRTEATTGYNLAAADIWERAGVEEVEEFDGLGGRTGKTDAECLARNGRRVSIDEFREDVAREHPNGTLGAVPVTVGVELQPIEAGRLLAQPHSSASIYAVTDAGLILSEEETGRALAAV